jgi:hypothetical protein
MTSRTRKWTLFLKAALSTKGHSSVRYMKMKRKYVVTALVLLALLVCLLPVPGLQQSTCMNTWQEFGAKVKQGDLSGAHAMLTASDQAAYPMATFTNAAIVKVYPFLLDASVSRFRYQPLWGSSSFLAGGQHFKLPLWMERDGIAASIKMKKENGSWKLKLPHVYDI